MVEPNTARPAADQGNTPSKLEVKSTILTPPDLLADPALIERYEREAAIYEERLDVMLNPNRDLDTGTDVAPDGWRKSDLGNAERLVARHGGDIKYCRENRTWYVWNDRCWAPDVDGELERRAHDTIRNLCRLAEGYASDKDRAELIKWSLQSENARRLTDMVKVAESQPDVAVRRDELDAIPYYLGCFNGVLDTRDGKLLPHDRKYLITKVVPVEYDPNATFELWDKFLDDATGGDEDLKDFLRRAVGCSLTAEPADDDRFFFIHGPPAGGKSTFIEAIRAVLGGYACTASFDTFCVHHNAGGARSDIAKLYGARLVTSVEIPQAKRLDEAMLASLTGGDRIPARFLYENEFEFFPQFKLWIAGNNEPTIPDGDSPVWRRLLKIPFTRVVPEGKRDPTLKTTFRDNPGARAAVLAWAVKGCLEWRKRGLDPPETVKTATENYRADQDVLTEFIDNCCVVGAEYKIDKDSAFREYTDWCDSIRLPYGDRLAIKGFSRRINADPRFSMKQVSGRGKKMIYGLGLPGGDF